MRYLDLLLYSENSITDFKSLYTKHKANLGYLKPLAAKHEVYAVQPAGFNQHLTIEGVHFLVKPLSNYRWRVPLSLFFRVRKMNPDVILVHSMSYAWQIIFLALIKKKNTVILVQNHAEQPSGGFKRLLEQLAAKSIRGFLFVSQSQAEPWIKKDIIRSSQKVFEVMEGSTDFKFTIRDETSTAFPVFLWVGRLDKNKDPLTILRAWQVAGIPGKLKMVYGSELLVEEVRTFINDHSLQNSVELLGTIPHNEMEKIYHLADYFILGSHYEGSGYALCEAMACGCVPVVTNIPSFSHMLGGEFQDLLFPPGDVNHLVSILQRVAERPLAGMREKIRLRFEKEFSHDAICQKIEAILENVRPDTAKV